MGVGLKKIPIYLINLDSDQVRLEFMDRQLQSIGLAYERFPAIPGTALPGWIKPYFLNDDGCLASGLSKGEVGCYASHLSLINKVHRSGKAGLIMEDDLQLPEDLPDILNAIIAVDIDFDILRLTFGNRSLKVASARLATGHKLVKYARVPACLGAYIISPKGAEKFLNWKQVRTEPVDIDMRSTWDCGMKTYGLLPVPITQNVLESSINKMNSDICTQRYLKNPRPHMTGLRRFYYNITWLGMHGSLRSLLGNTDTVIE